MLFTHGFLLTKESETGGLIITTIYCFVAQGKGAKTAEAGVHRVFYSPNCGC